MWNRRYPFAAAGRLAAAAFGIDGVIGGVVLALTLPNAPGPYVNGPLWAVLGAVVGFLVFATDAQQRPMSVRQAAAADGVVVGIVGAAMGVLLDLAAATGAGATTTSGPSTGQGLAIGAITVVVAAIEGGLLGLGLAVAGGNTALAPRHAPVRAGTRPRRGRTRSQSRRRPRG